jgi:hypothetical protein
MNWDAIGAVAEETSNGVYEVEGSDLWGRKVYCQGTDLDSLMAQASTRVKQIYVKTNAT